MLNKNVMILFILFFSFLAIGTVNATENVTNDVISCGQITDDIINIDNTTNNEFVSVEDNQIKLEENYGSTGTFTELSNLIKNTPEGATIILDKNYSLDNSLNSNVININKTITIDGNNHTLDGKKLSGILKVNANDVIIKNVNFINGRGYQDTTVIGTFCRGGAIYWTGNNGNLYDCTFSNNLVIRIGDCSAYGGAIDWSGKSGTIKKCQFINNSADIGGAIEWGSYLGMVQESIFKNNHASEGGAIQISSLYCTLSDSKFFNNSAEYGSAIKSYNDYCTIYNSSFEQNNAQRGTYFFESGTECKLLNCDFIDNVAEDYHNVYIDKYASLSMENNIFGCNVKIKANNATYGESVEVNGFFDWGINKGILNMSFYDGDTNVRDYMLKKEGYFWTILPQLYAGVHVLKINVKDDKNIYTFANNTVSFIVMGLSTEISAENISSNYKENSYLIAILKNSSGQLLSNLDIEVNINGNITTLTTDDNGQIRFNTNILPAGNYTALISFNGNYMYNESHAFSTVVINKTATKLNTLILNTEFNSKEQFTVATLKDSNDNDLTNFEVTIELNNGKKYSNIKTDSKGQVNIFITGLAPDIYTGTITFSDKSYIEPSSSLLIIIKKTTPKILAKGKTFKKTVKIKKYTVTLKTNQNRVMKNTKVTITVNKKTYSAKTNSKGVATFKLTKLTKKGKYTATVKYAGSKYYNAETVKQRITVK